MLKTCLNCGTIFNSLSSKRKFCCRECANKFNSQTRENVKKGNEIIIKDDYAIIVINSNKFGVKNVLIDIDDIEKVKKYTWCFTHSRDNNLYAMTKDKSKTIKLHRYLKECPKGLDIDHINHDTLDNRKTNLRICTRAENNHNLGIRTNTYTGFKYITHCKYIDKRYKNGFHSTYIIQINRNGIKFCKRSVDLATAIRLRNEFLINKQIELNIPCYVLEDLMKQKL